MDTLDAIFTRRSIRRFTPEPVSQEDLDALLRAAMAAPSASNERPWRFVIAQEHEMRSRLAKATPYAGPISHAPVGIVVCADLEAQLHEGFWVIDCSAAIQNLLLAANSSGLGAVWIGVHPDQGRMHAVAEIIGTPSHVVPHSMIALGHPSQHPEPVDRYDESWVHAETW